MLDTALWLDVISGGSREPEAPPPPERPFVEAAKTSPGKLRVAYSTLAPRAAAPPTVSEVVKDAVADAAELLALARPRGHASATPIGAGSATTSPPRFLARRRGDGRAKCRIPSASNGAPGASADSAASFPTALYERALRGRAADAARVNAIFDSFDVLITPVMGGTALPIRRWEGQGALRTVLGMSRFYPYCVPWNHLGNPAMSVPTGFADDGMPLAVQIIGRPGDEATLLSLAAQLEAERPWADARPPIS